MAWDSSRPIPWTRLVREWLIYALLATVFIVIFMRDRGVAGLLGGLLVSGPAYLLFGAIMAKFGYQRRTLKEAREESQRSRRETAASGDQSSTRPAPPPTKRTGANNPQQRPKRKKR